MRVFAYSAEAGTYAATLDGQAPADLAAERRWELTEIQDEVTAAKRDQLIGREVVVLVETLGFARSYREAPEIDGAISVPEDLAVGQFHTVRVLDAIGPDLVAEAVSS